jgi:hypothetical protein
MNASYYRSNVPVIIFAAQAGVSCLRRGLVETVSGCWDAGSSSAVRRASAGCGAVASRGALAGAATLVGREGVLLSGVGSVGSDVAMAGTATVDAGCPPCVKVAAAVVGAAVGRDWSARTGDGATMSFALGDFRTIDVRLRRSGALPVSVTAVTNDQNPTACQKPAPSTKPSAIQPNLPPSLGRDCGRMIVAESCSEACACMPYPAVHLWRFVG